MVNFRNLKIWERSHQLTLVIYRLTSAFPKSETYGLVSQLRRSVVSVPTNIAESCGRNSRKESAHFLNIALGSLSETEYLVFLSKDLGYIAKDSFYELESEMNEIKRMIFTFRKRLIQENLKS